MDHSRGVMIRLKINVVQFWRQESRERVNRSRRHELAHGSTDGGEQRKGPQDGGRRVGDLKGPEFQFAHAGHQRHGGAEGAQKAPEKNRPGPETMEEMKAFLQLLFIMTE